MSYSFSSSYFEPDPYSVISIFYSYYEVFFAKLLGRTSATGFGCGIKFASESNFSSGTSKRSILPNLLLFSQSVTMAENSTEINLTVLPVRNDLAIRAHLLVDSPNHFTP